MSVQSDLAAAFAEPDLTVPVQLDRTGAGARGFLDRGVVLAPMGQFSGEGAADVLHVIKGQLPDAVIDDCVSVGALGALSVVLGDPQFRVSGRSVMEDDGAFDHFLVVEFTR